MARKPGAKAAHLDPTAAEEFWEATVKQDDFEQVLLDKIGEIVRGPAWSQSLKGIYTAGLGRSLRYMMAKVGKVSRQRSIERSFTFVLVILTHDVLKTCSTSKGRKPIKSK